jgi:uncharacterized protein
VSASSALSLLLAAAFAVGEPAKPKLAVVIDDFGLTYPKDRPDKDWMALPFPVTYAVMPVSPRTVAVAKEVKAAGHELIIHFPFDKYLALDLPKDRVSDGDLIKVEKLLRKAFEQIPDAKGLNNHQSLRGTANKPMMEAFMKLLKPKGVYFLDSRVGPKALAYEEARRAGIPAAANYIFLDGTAEAKARKKDAKTLAAGIAKDKELCRKYLRQAAARAKKSGEAIAIGHHYYHGTYECLVEGVPDIQKEGVEIVFASALTK